MGRVRYRGRGQVFVRRLWTRRVRDCSCCIDLLGSVQLLRGRGCGRNIPKKTNTMQTFLAAHPRTVPSEPRLSIGLELDKNSAFHKLIPTRQERELREPLKNKSLRAKLSWKYLHHDGARGVGRWFELLGKGATCSCTFLVRQHTNPSLQLG